MITKRIKLKSQMKCFILYVRNTKYLILENNNKKIYLLIPEFLKISKELDEILLSATSISENFEVAFKNFSKKLDYYYNSFETVKKKKLILKGLGFRVSIVNGGLGLEFKIGFSHLIQVNIPTSIKVRIIKSTIILEGIDKISLGNFANKILSLKKPDCYKGKGFWYKYQKENLKIIKKK